MRYWIAAFAALCMLLSSAEGQAQGLEDPTSWTYEVKKKSAGEYELIFQVTLKDGWHIFSQKPGDEFLIPPSFSFDRAQFLKLVGKPAERGTLKTEKMEGVDNPIHFYEHRVAFVQVIRAKPGQKITGKHEYQVCNNSMCLPPKQKRFEFVISN